MNWLSLASYMLATLFAIGSVFTLYVLIINKPWNYDLPGWTIFFGCIGCALFFGVMGRAAE